jgi:hypothetical protein
MPDGAQVSFPDDMPKERIRDLIASKYPEAVPQPKPQQEPYSGSILPFSRDAEGNVSFDSNAGILGTIKRAVMLPGQVMKGEVPLYDQSGNISQDVIGRSFETAALMSPASPASGLKMAAPKMARPKPEGLQVAEAGQRIGVDLPRAAVSDQIAVQQAGKTVANVPIGGTPLRQASQTAISQMDDAARTVQQGYGSGSVAQAGSMARDSITDYATNTLKGAVKARYDAVDNLVTQNVTTPLSETAKTATDILARRQNAQVAGDSQAVRLVRKALGQKEGLNYQGLKDLRTSVGEMMDDMSLAPKGTSEGELKRIYASLTDDLRNAVKRAGGDGALAKWEEANTFAAKAAQERKALQSVLGRQTSDEGIFSKITAMAGSTSRADQNGLMRVRRAVSKETWDEISSAVISNLGRGPDGNFSPDRFVTAYGKLSETGKAMLFKSTGKKELAQSLDDLAMVSSRFKQLNQYANPSGTGQTVITGGLGAGLVVEPTTAISAVFGSRILAKVLAKPVSAKKLAEWAKAYEAAAVQPSVKTSALLEARAKVLATELAAETGAQSIQFLPVLSRVGQVPADQGDENQRAQENKQGRVAQQPDNRPWI